MTNRCPNRYWRCILRTALFYVFAIQAFLSAFETTIVAAHAPPSDTWLVICHGVDSKLPSSGGAGCAGPDEAAFCQHSPVLSGGGAPCLICALG